MNVMDVSGMTSSHQYAHIDRREWLRAGAVTGQLLGATQAQTPHAHNLIHGSSVSLTACCQRASLGGIDLFSGDQPWGF
jgi:hypothetical protein